MEDGMVVLKGAFFTSAYLGRVMQIRIHVISKAFFPLLADHQPGDGVTIIRLSSCLTQHTLEVNRTFHSKKKKKKKKKHTMMEIQTNNAPTIPYALCIASLSGY
jgi:hypothetical protein